MSKMHELGHKLYEFNSSDKADDSAARKAYQAMGEGHKSMFENSLEARKRIDAVLSKEQREQLRRIWRGG